MASKELIVLIVRDVGLRSALIARLSIEGESLVTLNGDPLNPVLDRIAPAPKILVIDTESLGDALQPLLDGEQWECIVILADRAAAMASHRVRMIDRRDALVAVAREFAHWRLAVS